MKKLLILAAISSLTLASCGGEDKKDGEDKKENSASLCECVTADQDNLSDDCKALKKEWETEFENADEAKKKEMTEEIMKCMDK